MKDEKKNPFDKENTHERSTLGHITANKIFFPQ